MRFMELATIFFLLFTIYFIVVFCTDNDMFQEV